MTKLSPSELGSYAGGAVSVASSLTLTEFGVLVGIGTALLTFLLNAWYTRRKNDREQRLAEREQLLVDLEIREREARLAQLETAK